MTLIELDEALRRVGAARDAAELFGVDGARAYRALAKALHPDHVPTDRIVEATAAFARLSTLWSGASQPTITSGGRSYRIGALLGQDEIADYRAAAVSTTAGVDEVVLKIAHRPADNDLLRSEAVLLDRVRAATGARHEEYLPVLRESLEYRDEASGADRAVNVFARLPGMISLATVAAVHPDGLDARDVAWMWRRLLVAIGLAHRAGVVHGAVVPDNVLVEPSDHGLVLVNWCYAVAVSGTVPALVRRYRSWYPPEVVRRGGATPGSDIYLATRCMVALMGEAAPPALGRFARGCLLPSSAARPDDAWRLLAELDEVLGALYGPRRFRPFVMPTTAPTWPRHLR
jgi:hypothetical protein